MLIFFSEFAYSICFLIYPFLPLLFACFLSVLLCIYTHIFVVLFCFLRKSIPWNAGVKQVWIHKYVKQQGMPSFFHMLSSIVLVQALQIPFGIVSCMFYKSSPVLTAPFHRLLPWWVERNCCFSAAQGKSLPFAQKRGCKDQRLPMRLACVWLKACSMETVYDYTLIHLVWCFGELRSHAQSYQAK